MAKRKSRKRRSRKRSSRKSSSGSHDFVVTSRVKGYLSNKGYRSSGDLVDELNEVVRDALEGGIERAKDNGRATVRPADL